MKVLSRIFISLMLLLSPMASAADDQAAVNLRTLLDAMNNLQGDFVQTTYDKDGVEQETSSGKFMLMRPGKFYWETREP